MIKSYGIVAIDILNALLTSEFIALLEYLMRGRFAVNFLGLEYAKFNPVNAYQYYV